MVLLPFFFLQDGGIFRNSKAIVVSNSFTGYFFSKENVYTENGVQWPCGGCVAARSLYRTSWQLLPFLQGWKYLWKLLAKLLSRVCLCARNWHYCRYAASIVFCSYDSHIVVAPEYPLRGCLVHSKGPPIIIAVTQFASLSPQSNILRLVVWTISIN